MFNGPPARTCDERRARREHMSQPELRGWFYVTGGRFPCRQRITLPSPSPFPEAQQGPAVAFSTHVLAARTWVVDTWVPTGPASRASPRTAALAKATTQGKPKTSKPSLTLALVLALNQCFPTPRFQAEQKEKVGALFYNTGFKCGQEKHSTWVGSIW